MRAAELEAEADKVRQVKNAEAQAQVTVLQAKAQADAMQHTLPLKEKQIQQSRLEAEARKEATVKNAEFSVPPKVVISSTGSCLRSATCTRSAQKFRRSASAL